MGSMISLNEQTFASQISSNDIVLVDFWAEWCMPCRMMLPILEKLSLEFSNVIFAKMNVDENHNITKEHGISSIPTLLIFHNGQVVQKMIGMQSENAIRDALANLS